MWLSLLSSRCGRWTAQEASTGDAGGRHAGPAGHDTAQELAKNVKIQKQTYLSVVDSLAALATIVERVGAQREDPAAVYLAIGQPTDV